MISPEEARTRVARGAVHLDRVRPHWFRRIDIGTLTLHDACKCVVGQLTGGLFRLERLGIPKTYEAGECLGVSYKTGIHVDGSAESLAREAAAWQPLQDAWIEAIADRWHAQPQDTNAVDPSAQLPGTLPTRA